MNRKAWIQIVEASISMLLLFGLTLGIMNEKSEKPDLAKNAYKIQHEILSEAENDPCIRNEMMGCTKKDLENETCDGTLLKNFIAKRLCHLPYSFTVNLCNPTQACLFPKNKEKPKDEIYANDIVISSNLTTFSPVKISMFAWTGGTPCEEYVCNLSAPAGPSGPTQPTECKCDGVSAVGSTTSFYSGPSATRNIGICHDGTKRCDKNANNICSWTVTSSEQTPQIEGHGVNCGNTVDDNCNGAVDYDDSGCPA